jgi:hypothetical protein
VLGRAVRRHLKRPQWLEAAAIDALALSNASAMVSSSDSLADMDVVRALVEQANAPAAAENH